MTEEALLALVESADAGDVAQRRQLFASLYDELHRVAQRELRRNAHATLSPTTLVNEAFLKLAAAPRFKVFSPLHFRRIVARAMRQVLVESARRRNARRRQPATGRPR